MMNRRSTILIVDDTAELRDLLAMRVQVLGHQVEIAEDGCQALEMLESQLVDLVLLDIMMPEINGYQVLETMKADERLQHIPVIVISAIGEIDSVARCIQLGAEDYLSKPFNNVLLKARIEASLERKRLRDQEQRLFAQVEQERRKSEKLLLNILPEPAAERLKAGEQVIADSFEQTTVMFADIVNFSGLTADIPPTEVVAGLNGIFSNFDEIVRRYELQKIKTIGDAYMLAGGVPNPQPQHASLAAQAALEIMQASAVMRLGGQPFTLRIGLHSGAVIAGVIGLDRMAYDLWGMTVNIASRMEAQSEPGRIQVSQTSYELLKDGFSFETRGLQQVRGIGEMETYFLIGAR
jgi:class 3 adenylate cyclase